MSYGGLVVVVLLLLRNPALPGPRHVLVVRQKGVRLGLHRHRVTGTWDTIYLFICTTDTHRLHCPPIMCPCLRLRTTCATTAEATPVRQGAGRQTA